MSNESLLDNIFFPTYAKDCDDIKHNSTINFVHYSNLSAIHSILTKEELWMSNVLGMNDISEVSYGIRLFRNYIIKDDNKLCKVLDQICKPEGVINWQGWLLNYVNNELYRGKFHAYISCLSVHEISEEKKYGRLSMWRCYANNGAALVFSSKFMDIINNMSDCCPYDIVLSKVHYYESDEFNRKVDEIADSITQNITKIKELSYEELIDYLGRTIQYAVISIKHPGFKEEEEWRLIVYNYNDNDSSPKLEVVDVAGNIKLVHKLKFDFVLKETLEKIIVGPNINWLGATLALKQDVAHYERNIEIEASQIPVRIRS